MVDVSHAVLVVPPLVPLVPDDPLVPELPLVPEDPLEPEEPLLPASPLEPDVPEVPLDPLELVAASDSVVGGSFAPSLVELAVAVGVVVAPSLSSVLSVGDVAHAVMAVTKAPKEKTAAQVMAVRRMVQLPYQRTFSRMLDV